MIEIKNNNLFIDGVNLNDIKKKYGTPCYVYSKSDIDETLANFMERDISSLDPIERNTLRLAAYEMLFTETDVPIIINESIRLTKKYGSADGHKYVNAVLDKMYKSKFEKTE